MVRGLIMHSSVTPESFLESNRFPNGWEEKIRRFLSEASQELRVKRCLVKLLEVHRDDAPVLFTLNANAAHAGTGDYWSHFLKNDETLVVSLQKAIEWGIKARLDFHRLTNVPSNWSIEYLDPYPCNVPIEQ